MIKRVFSMNIKSISIILVILIAALSRFIPHPPNFTPIIAMGLFSGFYLKKDKKLALLLPLSAMVLSDIVLGFHLISLFVYTSLAIITLAGSLVTEKNKFLTLFPATIGSSFIFFAISNFGVFLIGYPNSLAGFIACYTAAIPFFQNSLVADILFTGILFISYDLIARSIPQLQSNKIHQK